MLKLRVFSLLKNFILATCAALAIGCSVQTTDLSKNNCAARYQSIAIVYASSAAYGRYADAKRNNFDKLSALYLQKGRLFGNFGGFYDMPDVIKAETKSILFDLKENRVSSFSQLKSEVSFCDTKFE